MSKHNKWSKVKHKKGASDAEKGKLFTKLARLITMAAQQGGGDMETNASLRAAIIKAKSYSMPTDNIDRAIKKGTGASKEGITMQSLTYEAFGPGGVALLIHCITDNTNRAVANIRTILTKHGGHLGNSGSVSWLFHRKGLISAGPVKVPHDELELRLIDAGAQDLDWEGDIVHVLTAPESFEQCLKVVNNELVQKSEISLIADQEKALTNLEEIAKLETILELLHEEEDVDEVFTNAKYETGVENQ